MAESLEAQLRATLNMIPAYTWYATRSGGLIFVNERAADYGGLPSEHPLRHGTDTSPAWDSHIPFLHPEDQEETRRVWSECLRTGHAGEMSFRARNAEGGYRWFLSRAEPLRSNDGTILNWIGINLDIEERKQAEVELRRSKEYLADAVETQPHWLRCHGRKHETIVLVRGGRSDLRVRSRAGTHARSDTPAISSRRRRPCQGRT